jgi:hypothetical protein
MITLCSLFSSPKAFVGHNKITQYNSLRNWRALGFHIILFGNESGTSEAADIFNCIHFANVKKNMYGTPLLNDMFEKASTVTTTPLIAYINCDILLPLTFCDAAHAASEQWTDFLMIGRRWDIDIACELIFDINWPERLDKLRRRHGVLHGPWGIDYFVFPQALSLIIPPFAVGRPWWDIWLVGTLAEHGLPILNASSGVPVLHQNHDYHHVPGGNGLSWSGPEAEENLRLFREASPNLDPVYASIYRAAWSYKDGAIIPDTSWSRRFWYIKHRLCPISLCKKFIIYMFSKQKIEQIRHLINCIFFKG